MSDSASKVIAFASAPGVIDSLRRQGRRVALSHGVFDLLHPGHIHHLEAARNGADVLVVSVTAEKHVSKGPGRPYFGDQLRLHTLSALNAVDYVILVPFASPVEAVEALRPDVYGAADSPDPSGSMDTASNRELDQIRGLGVEVRLTGAAMHSATRLLNRHFDHLSKPIKEFCAALSRQFSGQNLREAVESFTSLKVLVVGDTIFDRYSSLKVQGLTSKNRIISGRFLGEETQCGGALAVFRHLKQFVADLKFISLTGTEPWVDPLLSQSVEAHEDLLVRDPTFTTIIKQRFVEPLSAGKELSKLFSVNFIDADPPSKSIQERVHTAIRAAIKQADVVLALDFGHGLMQPGIRELVQEEAPLLVLNCQTNSNNHGFNVISRQYRRADAFSLDDNELMLSAGHRHLDFQGELENLRRQLGSSYAWLTRGPVQTIGLREGESPCFCPPLECEVVDTIGAGDAFFSVAALAAARRLPIPMATFLGQLAGAQAVKIVGNSTPISKDTLLKSGLALLNF